MINSEITRHVSSKINEFKVDLNVHIRETIEQVISDQVLPTIRETLGEISSGARLKVDFTSSERCITARKFVIIYQNWIKLSNRNSHNIENSFEPPSSDEDYDKVILAMTQ